jgi:small conductance mechanosensitive channel
MTNEVAVAEKASCAINAQLDHGRELAAQVTTWVTEKGLDFAVNLAVAVLLLLVGWLVIRLIDAVVRKALMRGKAKQTLFVNFACSVVTKACWALLLIMVAGRLGVDVAPLIAGLGVTGFILGFAFQESLGNLASGMMIAINEPFKVGDVVDAAGHTGTIVEVNMMATVMKTADNKRIVIPNKSVWGGPIVNYNTLGVRRVDLQVGVDYGEDVSRAVDVIREAVSHVPGVLADPAPTVAVASLNESAVQINVRPWAKSSDYWTVAAATLVAVKADLERAGVKIPFPQIEVHNVSK